MARKPRSSYWRLHSSHQGNPSRRFSVVPGAHIPPQSVYELFYPGGSRRDAPRHECYGSESAEEPFTLPLRETRQFLYRSESIRRCRGEVAVPYAAVMCTCVSQNGELFAPSSEGILVVVALLLLRVQSIDVAKETETVCNLSLIHI